MFDFITFGIKDFIDIAVVVCPRVPGVQAGARHGSGEHIRGA